MANVKSNELYQQIKWVTKDVINQKRTYEYWNDRAVEADKAFDISDGNFDKVLKHVAQKGMLQHIEAIKKKVVLKGKGADIGAGICWLEPILFSHYPDIERVYCVEFSQHRIFELAPLYLKHYAIPHDKCVLCFGDFNTLAFEDNALDFVVVCQSFHHTNEPLKLMKELQRVIKKNGYIILIAEPVIAYRQVLRRYMRHLLLYCISPSYRKTKRLCISPKEFFTDDIKGDVHLLRGEYYDIAKRLGLIITGQVEENNRLSLIVQK